MYIYIVMGLKYPYAFAHLDKDLPGQYSRYIHLRIREITPLFFWSCQMVWDGSICQKWVIH